MKLKQYTICLLLFVLSAISVPSAQQFNTVRENELLDVIKKSSGTDKIDRMTDLVNYYVTTDQQKALSTAEEAIRLARSKGYIHGEADLSVALGRVYYELSDAEKAVRYSRNALNLSLKADYKKGIARAKNNLGIFYSDQGNFTHAVELLLDAAKISEENGFLKEASDSYNILGLTNYLMRDYTKAIQFTRNALSIREKIGDKLGIALSNENLGIIHQALKKYQDALKYHTNAMNIKLELGDKGGYAGSLDNVAIINRELKNYQKSIYYYNQALKIRKEMQDLKGIASVYSGIGKIYMEQKDYSNALSFLFRSYDIRLQTGDKRGARSSLSRITATYERMGDYNNALRYFKLYADINDTLYNMENTRNIAEMQAKYESEKKDKEIKYLEREQQMASRQRNILIAVIFLITGLVIIILIIYNSLRVSNKVLNEKNAEVSRQKGELQKLNDDLISSNSEKDKLFSIIAHDLRSPFTVILGYSEFLMDDKERLSAEEVRNFSTAINQSSKKVYALLENLLHWSRMNLGRVEFKPTEIALSHTVCGIIELYKSQIEEKKLSVSCDIDDHSTVYADGNMFELVLRNLLSNAVKFSSYSGCIQFTARLDGNNMTVGIRDFGTGIGENDLKNIFTTRMQSREGTSKELGTGLGLLLCKEMIEKNNGRIWVESRLNSGTTFWVSLPAKKQ